MKRLFVFVALSVLLSAASAQAKLLLSQKDALALALPAGAAFEKKTAYLTKGQISQAEHLAQAKVESAVWTYYVARNEEDEAVGFVYFDRVIVRTMPAAIMVSLDADGRLRFIEILTFDEPEDYLPRVRWLGLFKGRLLDDELRLSGAIRNVSGASLTSEAITKSARRLLAIHEVLWGESQ